MSSVGIIANPASGKDIRRLVAHGSVFDNNEKINIIQRVLLGLEALGLERVLAMPDIAGLAGQAYERAKVGLTVEVLDFPLKNKALDSTRAAHMMAEAGVGCIVTLGGDGTNRAVAKGCGYIPLVPISTGTNNAFPVMIEGTLAGLAAALVAQRVPGVREAGVRLARRLDVYREDQLIDFALIDVVAYAERFVASGAIAYTIPFGQADVKREGSDVTILTLSLMVHRSLDAAEKLAEAGISAEVIDLRTLVPLDKETIVNSVKKTHRVLIVDEDYRSYGMSGELIAIVAEEALDYLDAPPQRLAVPDVPIPYSRPMERYVIPSVDKIVAAATALVNG